MKGTTKLRKPINWNRVAFMAAAFLFPFFNFFVFYVYTGIEDFGIAFRDPVTKVFTLENFNYFFTALREPGSEVFFAVSNSLLFFLFSLFMLFANFVMGFFLYKKIFMYKIFRIIYYMPVVLSGVIMTAIFMEFIKPNGPLGAICGTFGITLPDVGLLNNKNTALLMCFVYSFWVGFTDDQLLFAGAFGRIPGEVLESARLDGCPPMTEALKIIFPLLWPTFSTMLILKCTGILGGGGVVQLLTGGEYGTMTISYWMFKQLYGGGSASGYRAYGTLNAAALVCSCITVPLILITKRITEKIPPVEY